MEIGRKERQYQASLKWRRKNKEKIRLYNLAYREKFIEREIKRDADRLKTKKSKEYFKQWRLKNREKVKAQYVANMAVKNGRIIRKTKCEMCLREGSTHMHHENYSKPLEVIFLCASCHRLVHRLR